MRFLPINLRGSQKRANVSIVKKAYGIRNEAASSSFVEEENRQPSVRRV